MNKTPSILAARQPMVPLMKSLSSGPQGSRLELGLYAPLSSMVQLVADFIDREPLSLKRRPDGWWRTSVELPDGEHHYRFNVRSNSYVNFGKMVGVLDPAAFPVLTEGEEWSRLIIRNGRREELGYPWEHDPRFPLSHRDLRIHELRAGDSIRRVIRDLSAVADQGVDCLMLVPDIWPPGHGAAVLCNLQDIFDGFGSPSELCRLVDACHARQIRVLLSCRFTSSEEAGILHDVANACWMDEQQIDEAQFDRKPTCDFTQFDPTLGVFPAKAHMLQAIRFWIGAFHLDGVRFEQGMPAGIATGRPFWTSGTGVVIPPQMLARQHRAAG